MYASPKSSPAALSSAGRASRQRRTHAPRDASPRRVLPRVAPGLTAAAIIALGLFAHRRTLDYALFGVDTYPQISASRIQSITDFVDTFRERLADGYIPADFFRPTQNLLLALDYALWELEPWGYHLTSLLTYAACIAVLYAVTRKLLGGRAWAGPVVASAFFALHPCQLDVVPVAAHRPELLVTLFLLLALLVSPGMSDRFFWRRCVAAGILVWLAAGAKEIGVIGCGLVCLHQLLFSHRKGIIRRATHAVLAAAPAGLGAAAYVVNRIVVLGGIGGYKESPFAGYAGSLKEAWSELLVPALCPWWFLSTWTPASLARVSALTLALLIVLTLVVAMLSRRAENRRPARLLLIGLAWLVPTVLFLGLSNKYRVWYALIPVAGFALVLAALAEGAAAMLRQKGWLRIGGLVPAGGVALVVCLALYASPLHTDYAEHRKATPILNGILRDLDSKLADAQKGDRLYQPFMLRYGGPFPDDRPYVARVPMLLHFSLQAWADLKYPEKHVLVNYRPPTGSPRPRAPDAVLLYVNQVADYKPVLPAHER